MPRRTRVQEGRPRAAWATRARRYAPLGIALILLLALTVRNLLTSLAQNQGHFTYALDDAYIHLAMARSLAEHGTWGMSPEGFTSSSSSIAWTIMIAAAHLLTGGSDLAPFVVAFASAVAALVLADRLLERHAVPRPYAAGVLVAIVYLTPLEALIFSGMEHTLQLALALAFLMALLASLAKPERRTGADWPLLVLAPLQTLARYEGAFLVAAAVLWLASQRRWRLASLVAALGAAPIVLYGALSLALGWNFLPNSVVLKAPRPDIASWRGVYNLVLLAPILRFAANPHVAVLFVAALALYLGRARRRPWDAATILPGTLAVVAYLHLSFASTGWFYRYEAYLVALGLIALAVALGDRLPTRLPQAPAWNGAPRAAAVLLAAALVAVPLVERAVEANGRVARATTNIYEQHVQMGRFLEAYYEGASVAANDIGAVNHIGRVRCLDLWGLASQDVAEARLAGRYSTDRIDELTRAHGVRVAIVYEHWFAEAGGLPSTWREAGEWWLQRNVVTGGVAVTFYAVDPAEYDALVANLRDFAPRLPPDVVQKGNYTVA